MELDNTKKIAINNYIVSMRHAVRKARVGVIWKLSKEIKHLNSRHGDEKIVQKCHRKAEKFVKEVQILKKIKDDEVTKFSLKNYEMLQQTLPDKKIDLKAEAIRRLASHKALKSKIDDFKKTYPDYQIYFQSKNTKSRVSMRVKNKTKSKPTTNDEWLVEDVSNTSTKLENTDCEEKITSESIEDTDDNMKKEVVESIKKSNPVVKKKRNTKNECILVKPYKKRSVKVINELVEVKKLNIADNSIKLTEVVKQNVIPNSDSNQDEGNKVDSNNIKVNREIDSFFMTGNNNEHYMSTAVPKSQTFNHEERWNDNTNQLTHRKKHFITNMRQKNKTNNYFNINEKKNQDNKNDKQKMKSVSNDKTELHPSWAARKKQQDIMKVAFQGKKIVFSDD